MKTRTNTKMKTAKTAGLVVETKMKIKAKRERKTVSKMKTLNSGS